MLTNRERDVLSLAGRGLTNQDIADELGISSRTVKCILHHACVKLRAHNRAQALFIALSHGYLSIQEILSLDELVDIFTSLQPEVVNAISQRLKPKLGHRFHPNDTKYMTGHAENRPMRTTAKSSLLACESAQRPRRSLNRNQFQDHQIENSNSASHYRKVIAKR